jgi:hypothetical protein
MSTPVKRVKKFSDIVPGDKLLVYEDWETESGDGVECIFNKRICSYLTYMLDEAINDSDCIYYKSEKWEVIHPYKGRVNMRKRFVCSVGIVPRVFNYQRIEVPVVPSLLIDEFVCYSREKQVF